MRSEAGPIFRASFLSLWGPPMATGLVLSVVVLGCFQELNRLRTRAHLEAAMERAVLVRAVNSNGRKLDALSRVVTSQCEARPEKVGGSK